MIQVYPGQGIGVTYRPVLGFTLGALPVGSVLSPVDTIISEEFLAQVTSTEPENVTSLEGIASVMSEEAQDLVSDELWKVISSLSDGTISVLPPEVRSKLPSDIVSDEPGGWDGAFDRSFDEGFDIV